MRELTSAEPLPPNGSGHVRGPEGAPDLIFYGDFTCPDCAVAALRLRDLPVRVHFRHFALSSRNRRAVPLSAAAEAAGRQGAFWEFHDSLFVDQGRSDDPHLWERCKRMGLDTGCFEQDRRSPAVDELVRSQTSEALRAGATATPSFLAGGVMYSSLDEALAG